MFINTEIGQNQIIFLYRIRTLERSLLAYCSLLYICLNQVKQGSLETDSFNQPIKILLIFQCAIQGCNKNICVSLGNFSKILSHIKVIPTKNEVPREKCSKNLYAFFLEINVEGRFFHYLFMNNPFTFPNRIIIRIGIRHKKNYSFKKQFHNFFLLKTITPLHTGMHRD